MHTNVQTCLTTQEANSYIKRKIRISWFVQHKPEMVGNRMLINPAIQQQVMKIDRARRRAQSCRQIIAIMLQLCFLTKVLLDDPTFLLKLVRFSVRVSRTTVRKGKSIIPRIQRSTILMQAVKGKERRTPMNLNRKDIIKKLFNTHIVAKTRRIVRFTSITISLQSFLNILIILLKITRMMVGTQMFIMLPSRGRPRWTSKTTPDLF